MLKGFSLGLAGFLRAGQGSEIMCRARLDAVAATPHHVINGERGVSFVDAEMNNRLSVGPSDFKVPKTLRRKMNPGVGTNGQKSKENGSSVRLFTTFTYCFAEGNMVSTVSNHLSFAGSGRQNQFQLGLRNKGATLRNLSMLL